MVRDIMSYCPECGKRVAPTAKFCRNCGASQLEESQSTSPTAAVPVVTRTCASCSNPVSQDEKFCGVCGAREGEIRQQVIPAGPPASPNPPPAPVTFPSLSCTSCGIALNPGTRFCGGCGSPVKGDGEGIPAPSTVPAAIIASPSPQPQIIPPPAPQPSQQAGVRICRSCGYVINPGDKFCKKCLAKVVDATSESPVPVKAAVPPLSPPVSPSPLPDPGTAATSVQSPGVRLCRSCGYVINPGDKFCKKCLAKVVDATSGSPVPVKAAVPPLSPPVSPSPLPDPGTAATSVQSPGVRLCRSCGYVINPGDKFCKKCLAKVVEDYPVAPPQTRQSTGDVAALSVTPPVCKSCGSPLGGIEKFCGICGTPVVPVSPEPAAISPGGAMTCTRCGAPISATTRFCGGCGMAAGAVPTPGIIPPAAPATFDPPQAAPGSTVANGEEVMGVIANARKMKMFGATWDTYTIVVTKRRMIFAQMTQSLLNAAIMEAQAKAKAEGKGFFAIVKDQMSAQFRFALRYETMSPDQSLSETAGNFAIENPQITAISLKLNDSGEMEYSEFKIIIESSGGKSEYLIGEDDRFINLLKTVYGERVHMPFGYFRAGGVRLKFF